MTQRRPTGAAPSGHPQGNVLDALALQTSQGGLANAMEVGISVTSDEGP